MANKTERIAIMLYVKNILNPDIETVEPSDSLNDAMKRMLVNDIHHLLVVEGERLIGLLSIRDLDVIGNEEARQGLRVEAAMITNMVTASPEMTVSEAAELMRRQTIGCLPVIENNKPVGIITTRDLLALLARTANRLQPVSQGV